MDINVMTFNIHHGKGMDKQIDLSRIVEVIHQCNPDIIGLNEVDKHFSKRSLYEDQACWIANQLKLNYAFSPSISVKSKHSEEMREYGNALLSRFPIVERNTHLFKTKSGIMEGRSLLEASIQIHRQLVQVNVTHLSLNPFLHRKQTDFIISRARTYSHPFIIMGDWNMKPDSKRWRKLNHEFQDAWEFGGKGAGYTYPSLRPRTRLDYIFTSHHLEIIEAKVITNIPKASDHLPLTAVLRC